MANVKILAEKQNTIDKIKETVNNSNTVVLFDYRGLTDNESKLLRIKLRENDSDYKVYKNTLMNRALQDLNIDLSKDLEGPSALAYGNDTIAPIKVLADFAKEHSALVLKVGIVDGEVSSHETLVELSKIPSREGLLTMLASGLIGIPRDLSICLDLYSKDKEN
ncbi:MAG: 50S ribosomal protein L10 [Bacilli bacterium]|nr:50S ribosomal protein L10 [Bacilli bacterium]